MSWDLMVFASDSPASVLDAHRLLDAMEDDDWQGPAEDEVDPRVRAFLDDMLAAYPALESLDFDSPEDEARAIWSVTPAPDSPVSAYLCMSWSSPPEVAETVTELASRHGLVLYDPQEDQVYNPA